LSASPDIPDFFLQACIAEENKVAAQISSFEPLVNREYPRLLKLCWRGTRDQNEASGIVHQVFCKLFKLVHDDMWAGELRKFRNPEAWLTRTALNAVADFRREQSWRRHGERPKRSADTTVSPKRRLGYRYASELPQIEGEDSLPLDVIDCAVESAFVSARRNPEEQAFDRQIVKRYSSALCQLTPLQRKVYIFCKDQLLQPEEQEQLLNLDARTARVVVEMMRARPHMRLVDVAHLLGRKEGTLSSELTRAKLRLQVELSDLRWRKPSELPVPKWSREFLVAFSRHRGFLRSLRIQVAEPGEAEEVRERDKELIRGMPGPSRQHESIRPLKQERLFARSMDMVAGWVQAPEPDDPQYVDLLKRIRELLKARKRNPTIAKELNAAHVPPRFGKTWHHTAVNVIARRAGLVKTRPAIPSVPLSTSAPTPAEQAYGGIADNRAAETSRLGEAADDALFKTPRPRQAGSKVSAKRTQPSEPVPKPRRKARRRNKSGKRKSIRGRQLRKTSITRMQRRKPLQKARRNARRPSKAAKGPPITGRKPRKTSIKRVPRSKPLQKARRIARRPSQDAKGPSITGRTPRKTSLKRANSSKPVQKAHRNSP